LDIIVKNNKLLYLENELEKDIVLVWDDRISTTSI